MAPLECSKEHLKCSQMILSKASRPLSSSISAPRAMSVRYYYNLLKASWRLLEDLSEAHSIASKRATTKFTPLEGELASNFKTMLVVADRGLGGERQIGHSRMLLNIAASDHKPHSFSALWNSGFRLM